MLRRKYGGKLDEKGHEYLGYIAEGSSRMESLLRDLRAFTHVSLAQAGPAPATDANAVLENSLKSLKLTIEASGAQITSGTLPSVRLHEFQLEQLFLNIVGNAIRYRSAAAPRIQIDAVPEGDTWKFSIQDNGIGIAAEYKEHIFGIFKRLHSASEYPGTGMGLAICQRVVTRAGGRIWVESEPGRGSTFLFTLPGADSV
jgi:light-regulated signal transduction histidine kinase (bacteriophytochrome)